MHAFELPACRSFTSFRALTVDETVELPALALASARVLVARNFRHLGRGNSLQRGGQVPEDELHKVSVFGGE